jgi:predicted  nucleic acid-binding Zn-ribbon protein
MLATYRNENQMTEKDCDSCHHAKESDALNGQIDILQGDISDIKSSMGKIADAVTRLAVLEEKHQTTVLAMERIMTRIERDENRIGELEKAHIRQETAFEAYARAVKMAWAVLGAGVLYMGSNLIHIVTGAKP